MKTAAFAAVENQIVNQYPVQYTLRLNQNGPFFDFEITMKVVPNLTRFFTSFYVHLNAAQTLRFHLNRLSFILNASNIVISTSSPTCSGQASFLVSALI
jgi:hypothetical protein